MKLSVCIPTYNFGKYIAETIQSVSGQMRPGVEIVVFDSASTDDTAGVVQGLQASIPALRYEKTSARRGIDRDMASAVELTRGEYCWLLSADDVMRPGSVDRILSEIELQHDLYVCAHRDMTIAMQPLYELHPLLKCKHDASFQLADRKQQHEYFSMAASSEAFFSFISGLVVKRSVWSSVAFNEEFAGSCWAHVARFFEIMGRGLSVKFIAAPLIDRRGDNDSFATHGVVRRFALSIHGFQRLARHFWGKGSTQSFHIDRVLRTEFPMRQLLSAKALCAAAPQSEDKNMLDQLVVDLYSDAPALERTKKLLYRHLPASLFLQSRRLYRIVRGRPP